MMPCTVSDQDGTSRITVGPQQGRSGGIFNCGHRATNQSCFIAGK